MNLVLPLSAIVILQEATNVHPCFKFFFDSQFKYEVNKWFFFWETPFLIKEQKVLRFKVKVDIVVSFQQFFGQRIFS